MCGYGTRMGKLWISRNGKSKFLLCAGLRRQDIIIIRWTMAQWHSLRPCRCHPWDTQKRRRCQAGGFMTLSRSGNHSFSGYAAKREWRCSNSNKPPLKFPALHTSKRQSPYPHSVNNKKMDCCLPTTPPRFAVNAVCPPFDRLPTFRLSWF